MCVAEAQATYCCFRLSFTLYIYLFVVYLLAFLSTACIFHCKVWRKKLRFHFLAKFEDNWIKEKQICIHGSDMCEMLNRKKNSICNKKCFIRLFRFFPAACTYIHIFLWTRQRRRVRKKTLKLFWIRRCFFIFLILLSFFILAGCTILSHLSLNALAPFFLFGLCILVSVSLAREIFFDVVAVIRKNGFYSFVCFLVSDFVLCMLSTFCLLLFLPVTVVAHMHNDSETQAQRVFFSLFSSQPKKHGTLSNVTRRKGACVSVNVCNFSDIDTVSCTMYPTDHNIYYANQTEIESAAKRRRRKYIFHSVRVH